MIPLVLIPLFTFTGMTVYQWLKHIFWPNISVLDSHIHTNLFLTAISMVGGFLLCRYLEARTLLVSIVESSEDAIVGLSLDGIVFSWNKGAEKIYGYQSKEVMGKPLSTLLPADRPEDVSKILEKIKRGERVDHYETIRVRKGGQTVHVSLTVSPILNAAGRVIGASSIIRDITKRKETEDALHESEARLARTQAFSLVMVAHLSLDGRWLKVPLHFCELLGYSEEQLLALKSEDVTWPGDVSLEWKHYEDLIQGRTKSVDLEKRCVTSDGRILWLYINYSIVTDTKGNPVHFLAYIRDITKSRMAEEELQQTNAYLENVFENSPDAIGIVDEHGKFIKWNRMAAELYGYSFEELRGKSGFDLYADPSGLEEMLNCLRREGSVKKWETSMRKKDGSVAPIELSIGLLRDSGGKVLGSVGVARDLSEIKDMITDLQVSNELLHKEIIARERAEEDVERLNTENRMILEAAGEGIVGLDLLGRITFINPAGAEITGYVVEELIGKNLHEALHHSLPDGSPDIEHECPLFQSLAHGVTHRERDEVFWRKDGTSFPVAYSSTPIVEKNRILGAVITFRDITFRKRALEELSQYRDHLEDLVQERTSELARANAQLTREIEERKCAEEALQESSQKLKLFAYSVAHDLKSPAIGIHGLTQRLHKQYGQVFDEKGNIYCNQILKASEHIASLVEQVNIYIATKENTLIFEQIELSDILKMLRDEFSARLNMRRIVWSEPEGEVSFQADRLSVLRIFRNLVDNAVKYGGQGLTRISIGYEARDDCHVFSVSDDGKGIRECDSEKIFAIFQRNEKTRDVEGTGLGLTIVKEIAEKHGGNVWVEQRDGGGTTFCVSLASDLGVITRH